MYQDFKDLFSAFHMYGVKYLIVGGYAVSLQGQPRATKDIDVFIKADPPNAKAVCAALPAFGSTLENINRCRLGRPAAIPPGQETGKASSLP